MGFRYAFLCDLLEKLQTLHSRYPPYLPRDLKEFTRRAVTTWFQKHGYKIRAEADPFVLLSFLLADKYNDRDYGLSGDTIERIIGRAFSLSSAQLTALRAEEWNGSSIDLGTCVQLVTGDRDSKLHNLRTCNITIEEVAGHLAPIAFSGRTIQQSLLGPVDTAKLASLYKRLKARERKWLTRLILKDYSPIIMPYELVCGLYHELLPGMLMMGINLRGALDILGQARAAGVAGALTTTMKEGSPALPKRPEPTSDLSSSSPSRSSTSRKRRSSQTSEILSSSPKRPRLDVHEDDTATQPSVEAAITSINHTEQTRHQTSQVTVQVTDSQIDQQSLQALSDITGRRYSDYSAVSNTSRSVRAVRMSASKEKGNLPKASATVDAQRSGMYFVAAIEEFISADKTTTVASDENSKKLPPTNPGEKGTVARTAKQAKPTAKPSTVTANEIVPKTPPAEVPCEGRDDHDKCCEVMGHRGCTFFRRCLGYLTFGHPEEKQTPLLQKHGIQHYVTLDELMQGVGRAKYREEHEHRMILTDRVWLRDDVEVPMIEAARAAKNAGCWRKDLVFVEVYDVRLLEKCAQRGYTCDNIPEEYMNLWRRGGMLMAKKKEWSTSRQKWL